MKSITLEISLKPFLKYDDESFEDVCRKFFEQWRPLTRETPCISVLLWTADGSEILDYAGNGADTFDWARYVGGANVRDAWSKAVDPEGKSLHTRPYLYRENPPEVSYSLLAEIVSVIHRVGKEMFPDKTIRVGETFDPGPEFARSTFKYDRHNEICSCSSLGRRAFICAYEKLNADTRKYAGFPNGIPQDTPFGTFFGKQCQAFLTDMGFDYIWFSNGLGFGRDVWSTMGALFDGKEFSGENLPVIRQEVLNFWKYFRAECPDFPIETRGTNMSAGIDMATDGVSLGDIYNGGFKLLPPPNSPWAALDFDFGLELMGHLSRIAEVPDDGDYLFRYYIHDPWWANSPWYDRYNGMPHDIYLPMALARINKAGKVCSPTHLNLLSIDNSWGELPDSCADEPIPHLRKAIKEAPDAPSPVVWVYPFNEYSNAKTGAELARMFAGDWFVRNCIADGVPVTTSVSTDSFLGHDKKLYAQSVLLTPVPVAGSAFETAILDYAKEGGKVIFYGSVTDASPAFRDYFSLACDLPPKEGEFSVTVDGKPAGKFAHSAIISDGMLNTRDADGKGFAFADGYVLASQNGNAFWTRGTLGSKYSPRRLQRLSPRDFFLPERLVLTALARLGWTLDFTLPAGEMNPVIMLHRYNGALMLSSYHPSTTVETRLRFPLGAPVLDGYETYVKDGFASYHFPKAEHREIRVFVEQAQEGVIGVREVAPVSAEFRRRIEVKGLADATVRVFGETYCAENVDIKINSHSDNYFVSNPPTFEGECHTDENGTYFEVRHVTGKLVFSMPMKQDRPWLPQIP